MEAFGDRIQALMNEVYSEYQKEENKNKSKWEILEGFPETNQIAVLFGNFNYQVENGGISQWIYNSYFHDDAEKLTEYLEIGAEFDERFKKILDDINRLDKYARKTDCDRYGDFFDSEDDREGFIGEIINCAAFDRWYYDHCGKDDWWEVVCGIIDQVKEPEIAPAGQEEHDGEGGTHPHPLRVYIENANNANIGGFTVPLPATAEDLRAFLDGAEIKIADVLSDITGLGEAVTSAINQSLSPLPPESLNELNYLAAKIAAMDSSQLDIFAAVTEAKSHCGSIAEIINIAENLNCFTLRPALSAEQYGEFLLDADYDACADVVSYLEKSENPAERALFSHINRLERAADAEKYGYNIMKDEGGVFTKLGYLTEDESAFKEAYRGPEDIPGEYRLIAEAAHKSVMVTDTDLPALLMEMHALGGEYMRDAKYNINALVAGDDFLVMVHPNILTVIPSALAFRNDTDEHRAWTQMDGMPEDASVFVMSVTSHDNGKITGDLCETDLKALRGFFQIFNASFTSFDIEMKDDTSRRISLDEWNKMAPNDREQLKSWTKNYEPADETRIMDFISALRWAVACNRQQVTPEELVSQMNAQFMASSKHPQHDMLRISQDAAKEILAKDAAPVFRLTDGKAERLSPIDAVKPGLGYSFDREFAIRREDLPLTGMWAQRGAEEILRQAERGERNKDKNKNGEL